MATGASDGTVRIFLPLKLHLKKRTLPCAQTLTGFGGTVTAICFFQYNAKSLPHNNAAQTSSCGLLIASTDRKVKLWVLSNGSNQESVQNKGNERNPLFICSRQVASLSEGWFTCITVSSIVSASMEHEIFLGDSQGRLHRLKLDPRAPRSDLSVEQKDSGARGQKFGVHALGIFELHLLHDHAFLATLAHDGKCRVFDCLRCATFATFANKRGCKYTALGSNARGDVLLGDEHGFLEVWNVRSETCLISHKITPFITTPLCSNQDEVETSLAIIGTVKMDENSRVLLNHTSCICEVEIIQNLPFQEYHEHKGRVVSICSCPPLAESHSSPNANVLLTASFDNTIKSWDWYTMKPLFALREKQSEISCMAYIREINALLTGHENGVVKHWNLTTGATAEYKQHQNLVSAMDVSWSQANGSATLLTADYHGMVAIWSIAKKQSVMVRLLSIFRAHEGYVSPVLGPNVIVDTEILSIKYCESTSRRTNGSSKPTPSVLFTGGSDRIIRSWHVVNCTVISELRGHSAAITCLEVVQNGSRRKLLSGSDDFTIRVWDVSNLKKAALLFDLCEHKKPVIDLKCFITESHSFCISCSHDKSIKVLQLCKDDINAPCIVEEFIGEEYSCISASESKGRILAGTEDGKLLVYPFKHT